MLFFEIVGSRHKRLLLFYTQLIPSLSKFSRNCSIMSMGIDPFVLRYGEIWRREREIDINNIM